jgi:hypothetical protein
MAAQSIADSAGPSTTNRAHCFSVAATCLTRPPRGQLADRRPLAGLVVGETLDGEQEQATVLLQQVEEVGALAGELGAGGWLCGGGHGTTLGPATDTGA